MTRSDYGRAVALWAALTLAFNLIVGWAPGPGVRDLGGGWTTNTATANTLIFSLNGTEKLRLDSTGYLTAQGPVQADSFGAGCTASTTQPTYRFAQASGASYPTESNVRALEALSDGIHVVKQGGTEATLWASTLYASTAVNAAAYADYAGTGPTLHSHGLGLNGHGIYGKSGTPTEISTGVWEVPIGPSALANSATGTIRIGCITGSLLSARTPAVTAGCSLGASAFAGTLSANGGITVAPNYSASFGEGSVPAAATGYWRVYANSTSHKLEAKSSGSGTITTS